MKQNQFGHAVNLGNLEQLIIYCKDFGTIYNPRYQKLRMDELNRLNVNASDAQLQTHVTRTAMDLVANERQAAFYFMDRLAVRVVNAFKALGANKMQLADARSILRKLRGERAGGKKKKKISNVDATVLSLLIENSADTGTNSVGQMDFDNRLDHFTELLSLISQHDFYDPNEHELSLTGLNNFLLQLKKLNTDHSIAFMKWNKALIIRNQVFYDDMNGLVDIAQLVKTYVKSIFGFQSPQFRQVRKLRFVIIRSGK